MIYEIDLIFARAAHYFCTFLCRCFARLQRDQKLLSYTFYGGNVVRVPVHFFSLPLIFTLHWWPLAFLILSPQPQNFHVVLVRLSEAKRIVEAKYIFKVIQFNC